MTTTTINGPRSKFNYIFHSAAKSQRRYFGSVRVKYVVCSSTKVALKMIELLSSTVWRSVHSLAAKNIRNNLTWILKLDLARTYASSSLHYSLSSLSQISINLLAFYHESRSLTGYSSHYLYSVILGNVAACPCQQNNGRVLVFSKCVWRGFRVSLERLVDLY